MISVKKVRLAQSAAHFAPTTAGAKLPFGDKSKERLG